MAYLTTDDLAPFTSATPEQLAIIVTDLEARAVAAAPCLAVPGALTPAQTAAVVAVLRSAALRWADRATGDRQLVAGPFTYGATPGANADTGRRPLLWPSEITDLQAVCAGTTRRAVMGWLA